MSAPALVAGSLVSHLLSDPATAFEGIKQPLGYVLAPLGSAYEADDDVALFGYLMLQMLLLLLVWAFYGGALYRQAAVGLARREAEEGESAMAFAARHWRAFVGARLVLWMGVVLPLAALTGLALLGRVPGWPGAVLLALAILAGGVLALVAALLAGTWLFAGFLQGPTIATEDSDAFDALSRTFGYAAAGMPRLLAVRLWFLSGVLVGALWRLALTVLAVLLGWACLTLGAGAESVDRALAILTALGEPPDAERLGVVGGDYVVAGALALVLFVLFVRWLADAIVRVVCGRTAAYLYLRQQIDEVDVATLRTPPAAADFRNAEEAGFEEVGRIGN